MNGYVINIEHATLENENFRQVLYTVNNQQLVVMSLKPNEEIGLEVHKDNDQFIRIEKGDGYLQLNDKYYELYDGIAMIIPKGTKHNVVNTSSKNALKLYMIYSPPHHEKGKIDVEKPRGKH